MEQATRSRLITGVMLILFGLALFGLQYIGDLGDSIILLGAGLLFVAGYLYSRTYLLLVLGCIVVGLGIGSLGERSVWIWSEYSKIGLGIGFILIYLIDLLYRRRSHWWPLIPGVVLILLGLRSWGKAWRFLVSDGWPLILVIIGVLVLLGAVGRKRKLPQGE